MIIGIIGCGNMGGAIARGILRNETLREDFPVRVYARRAETQQVMREAGAEIDLSPLALAQASNAVLLAVKPYQIAGILGEIAPALTPEKLVISVAAGVTIAQLHEGCARACPVARVMPNTLVAVGQGLFGVCHDTHTSPEAQSAVRRLFSGLGSVIEVAECSMNAFSALAGCGPAYVFYMADALIEAGVSMGLTRAASTDIAFSLLRGSAALAAKSGEHPAVMREQVTSPGGMTIAGINHLDRAAVRGSIVDAVLAAAARGSVMESK